MHHLGETPFDKLDFFNNIPYSDNQKLFTNMAILDFGSICVQQDLFRDPSASSWIGKNVPLSVSISSILIEQSVFLSNFNPAALAESFVDAPQGLAT